MNNFVLVNVWDSFFITTAGTLQEPAVPQEHGGEVLSRALHLEEVEPEPTSEWQTLANVF